MAKPTRRVAFEMVFYTIAMIVTTLVLVPVAGMTWVYLVIAAAYGASLAAADRASRYLVARDARPHR